MNKLLFVIPSNMKNKEDVRRVLKSIDLSTDVSVIFINQSDEGLSLCAMYSSSLCNIHEIRTNEVIPLSKARNLALDFLYNDDKRQKPDLIMFIDDDAWFPEETVQYLLTCEVKGMVLKTYDPLTQKSFRNNYGKRGIVKGYHVCCDIISICMVLPYGILEKNKVKFNEKLGLGCEISQGEESLFVYGLYRAGLNIFYDTHEIYHPYKKGFNIKNFYSLAYFWGVSSKKVSILFGIPGIKLLIKYSVAVLLSIKDRRYMKLFIAVWRGFLDGRKDLKSTIGG